MDLRNVEEQAKQELDSLEAQYPNKFDYLKAELKSFIFLLQSDHPSLALLDNKSISMPTSSSATTQASCSVKKRKKSEHLEACRHKKQRSDVHGNSKDKRDRVEVVLERARACLRQIQQVKSGFFF